MMAEWSRRDLGMFTVGLITGSCTVLLALKAVHPVWYDALSATGDRTAEEHTSRALAELGGRHARPSPAHHHHHHRGDLLRHAHVHTKHAVQAAHPQMPPDGGGGDRRCSEFRNVLQGF